MSTDPRPRSANEVAPASLSWGSSFAAPESPPARLLLVEDEAVLAMDLAFQLQDMGYVVCGTADRCDLAVELARSERPDLILMDIVIKGSEDGITASEQIRASLGIPVVFLTAYGDLSTVTRAAQTAPYGYVTKPYKARELRAAIEVALFKSRIERRLRESERWFSDMLRCVGDGVVATDRSGRIRFMNPAAEAIFERRVEDVVGQLLAPMLPLTSLQSGRPVPDLLDVALREGGQASIAFAMQLLLPSGRRVPLDLSAAPLRDEQDAIAGAVLALRDITPRLLAEQALREGEERFHSAFDLAPSGMALVSLDGRFLECNAAMLQLLQRSSTELERLNQFEVTHREDIETEQQHLKQLLSNELRSVQFEKRFRRGASEFVWALASVSLLSGQHQPMCYLYQVHDLSRHKDYEHQLMQLAHYDGLTGLNNRAHMRDILDRLLLQSGRSGKPLAVVFADLDHFKAINDSLGHDAGDRVLQVVARRLKSALRRSDAVGRLGGDEFLLVLPDVGGVADIAVILRKVRQEFLDPIRLQGHNVTVGLSLGVALFPADGEDSVSLLRCADSALYHAKERGRDNWQFYSPDMTERVRHRMRVEADLRRALDKTLLLLHYQPVVPLNGDRPLCFEALVRWPQADGGCKPAGEFIEVAESSGLIEPLGRWALYQACRDAARWPSPGAGGPIEVAVNVSVRQFAGDTLVDDVRAALSESGLAPGRLCLEITERLWLRDNDHNLQVLQQLKALGVQIAIDDFGVGYSSFQSIERLQPDQIKIDGTLLAACAEDRRKGAIVRAVIAMAHALAARVVAECVETAVQRDFLLAECCDYGQGFLFSAAVPECEVPALAERLSAEAAAQTRTD